MEEPPALGSNLRNAAYMFRNCESLKYAPYIPHSVKNCKSMFMGCKSLDVSHMPKELKQDSLEPEPGEVFTDNTQSTDDNEKVRCSTMSKKSIIYPNNVNNIIEEGHQDNNRRDKPDFTDDNGQFVDKGDSSVYIDKDKSDLIASGSDHGDNSDPYMLYGGEEGGRAVAMQGADPPFSGNKYFADTDPNDNTLYDIGKKYATTAYNESQDDDDKVDNKDDNPSLKADHQSDNIIQQELLDADAGFTFEDNDIGDDGNSGACYDR